MAHLHTLHIKPQIYVDLLEGDEKHPYYLYIGATEDYIRRYHQKIQSYDDYHSGNNDGWSTPEFCRKHHKVIKTLELSFVDGGRTCAEMERHTFMKYFHLLDCNMDVVRGADWCRSKQLEWTDCKFIGRHMKGPPLRDYYSQWKAKYGSAIDLNKHNYLGWMEVNLAEYHQSQRDLQKE
jgi:hypothetical protein